MHIILVFSIFLSYILVLFASRVSYSKWLTQKKYKIDFRNHIDLNYYQTKEFEIKKYRKALTVLGGLLLFLYGALRDSSVGTDILTYELLFETVKSLSFADIINSSSAYAYSRDPLFFCFLKSLSYFWDDPQIMLIVISAIVSICVSTFIYKNLNSVSGIFFSFIIFVTLRYYSFTLSGLRQSIALSLILVAYEFIKTRKIFKFFVLVIIASLFHKSAIIFLVAYPLGKINKIGAFSTVIFSITTINIISGYYFINFISNLSITKQYEGYLQIESTSSGLTTMIIYIGVLILSLLSSKQILKRESSFSIHYCTFTIGIALSTMMFKYANIFRIGYYFILSIIVLFPTFIDFITKNKKINKMIFTIAITLLITQYIIIGPGAGTNRYIFFWQ